MGEGRALRVLTAPTEHLLAICPWVAVWEEAVGRHSGHPATGMQ